MFRRAARFGASDVCAWSPAASMYARRSAGVRRASARCAASGVVGVPKAWIFRIALASSGF